MGLTSLSHAQVGAHVPDYDVAMPFYFSGTNSRAIGNMYVKPPPPGVGIAPQFLDAQLYVNSHLVRSWTNPAFDAPYPHVELAVMFDSSHFASGSTVHVRITGHDNIIDPLTGTNRFYDSDVDDPPPNDAPVKNWSSLYGRFEFEVTKYWQDGNGVWHWIDDETTHCLPPARTFLTEMFYPPHHDVVTLGWTAAQACTDSEDCNVLLINSHSNPDYMWSDTNDPALQYMGQPIHVENIYGQLVPNPAPSGSDSLLAHRIIANGIGLPPYNLALTPIGGPGRPPINVAFMSGCNTGSINQYAEGTLYPYGNVYVGTSQYPEDQACCGFAITFRDNGNARAVHEAFWGALANSFTVVEARTIAFYLYEGENIPSSPEEFITVFGDFYTRLKSVYTGDINDAGWYRNI